MINVNKGFVLNDCSRMRGVAAGENGRLLGEHCAKTFNSFP